MVSGNRFVMRLLVLREKGVPIPRHRWCFLHSDEGYVRIAEEHVPDWNRSTKVAHWKPDVQRQHGHEQAPLYDAVIQQMEVGQIVLSGVERVPNLDSFTDYAQTWLIVPAESS